MVYFPEYAHGCPNKIRDLEAMRKGRMTLEPNLRVCQPIHPLRSRSSIILCPMISSPHHTAWSLFAQNVSRALNYLLSCMLSYLFKTISILQKYLNMCLVKRNYVLCITHKLNICLSTKCGLLSKIT